VASAQDLGVDLDVQGAIVAKEGFAAKERYAPFTSVVPEVVSVVRAAFRTSFFEPGVVVAGPAVAPAVEPVVWLLPRRGGGLALAEDLIGDVAAANDAAPAVARADAHASPVAGPHQLLLGLDLHLELRLAVHLDAELRQRFHAPALRGSQ